MKFNTSKGHDFPTEIGIPGFKNFVSMTEETKLLGVIITSDLKWEAHTNYICSKALQKMWVLRRLKSLDVSPNFLVDVYKKEVRSLLEIAVPAWHSGLTDSQSQEIERVQKVAMSILLGKWLPSEQARQILDLEPLAIRRENICKRFAKKTLNSRHSDIFERKPESHSHNLRFKEPFVQAKCKTKRFYDSPVNFMTRILNEK